MRDESASAVAGVAAGTNGGRRGRLVPPAVTPLRASDLAAGIAAEVRRSGRPAFRDTIGSYLDADTVETYTSYRRALSDCLRTLTAADDGEAVLVPAFCSSDYDAAVEGAGLRTRRYDVDPETLAADPAAIREVRTDDALALVVVSPLGYGSPMAELSALCADRDIRLVEALGYAIGSAYRGRPLGTFGDCAVLNFQQGKPIPVGGGLVTTQDPDLAVGGRDRPAVGPNVATLSGYGLFGHPRAYALYADVLKPLYQRVGPDDHVSTHPESKTDVAYEPPFAAMSHFQCAVGKRIFDRRTEYRRQRARSARTYARALADCPGVDLAEPVAGLEDHQYVRFPLFAASAALRREIRDALDAVGVQASRLYDWPPLDADRFPGAARVQERIVTLPTHPYVTERDRELVVDQVRAVAGAGPRRST